MEHGILEWGAFLAFVLGMLALDLGVFHRKDHVVGTREALGWSALWVALALAFGGYVWMRHGSQSGLEFLTGYVIETSLSIDNIFVFVVIFGALGIPALYQHRVLFWGILSALVLRGAMIWGGSALLHRFHAIIYVFGAFLVLTGLKLLLTRAAAPRPAPRHPGHAAPRRQPLLHARERQARGDAALLRAGAHRGDRRRVRRRLD